MADLYPTEFPGFVLDVRIPAGFVDVSWHNDAAPCWENATLALRLWIDDIDPDAREWEGAKRFMLATIAAEGECGPVIISSDDWSTIAGTIARLAGDAKREGR